MNAAVGGAPAYGSGGVNVAGSVALNGGSVGSGGAWNIPGSSGNSGGSAGRATNPVSGASSTAGGTNTGGSTSSIGGIATTGGAASGGHYTTGGAISLSGGSDAIGGTSAALGGKPALGGTSNATGGTKAIGGSVAQGGTTAAGTSGTPGGSSSSGMTCNLVIGNSTTQQWFDGGFLSYPQIDPSHWELIWVAHHYINLWAAPSDSGWSTPFDSGHKCANSATSPDRVIFIVTYAPPYPSESTYESEITSVVNNIKAKYATVKRIELTTLIRSPGNIPTACSSQANNEQSIPAAEDQAIAAVAAAPAFAGLVFALPPFYVTTCSDFNTDAPQYTTTGAANIAKVYGAYFTTHP